MRILFSVLVIIIFTIQAQSQEKSIIQVQLITGHPLNIIVPGHEAELKLKILNQKKSFQSGWLNVRIESYAGENFTLKKEIILKPEASIELYMPDLAFTRKGIHWVSYSYFSTSGDTAKGKMSYAYMEPVGNDYHRDKKSFKFGIAGIRYYNQESFELQLKASQLMGAAYERKFANWSQIQSKPGVWKWDYLDDEIATAEKYGLERQLLINGSAPWAVRDKYKTHPNRGNTPPKLKAWEDYTFNLAKRYKDRIEFYEIWNEPDIGFYHGTTDEYLDLLKSAYKQIKKVDSDLQVMSGGFASAVPRPTFFKERGDLHREVIIRGQQYFDVHAFHRHSPFSKFREEVEGPLKEIRSHLKSEKPVWYNETAMHSTFIGEKEQARILFKKLTFGWAMGAMGYTWFNMLSNPNHPPSHHEHNYGMLTSDFNPKAVYVVYNELVKHLHDKQFLQILNTPVGYYAFLFGNEKEKVITSWKEDETLPDLLYLTDIENESQIEVFDLMGNQHELASYKGQFPLQIDRSCKFVKIKNSGDLKFQEIAINPVVSVSTNKFEIDVEKSDESKAMQTQLVCPSGKIIEDHGKYLVEPDFSSFFAVNLVYNFPEAGWYGKLEIPVRLLTPLTQTDWIGRSPDFILDKAEQVTNRYEHDPASTHLTWKGPEDLSAEGWFQNSNDSLKISLVIQDDQFIPSKDNMQGDFIELMLYPKNIKQMLTYRLEIVDDNLVNVQYSGSEIYKNKFDYNFKPYASNQILHQLAISFDTEIFKSGIGYNLQIHDNDGVMKGYIQLAPGMGVMDEPGYFPVLMLDD